MKRMLFIAVIALSSSIDPRDVQAQGAPQTAEGHAQQRKAAWTADLLVEQLTRKLAQAEGSDTEFRIAEDMEILASIVRDNLDATFADAARDARDPHRHFADYFFRRADMIDSEKAAVERCSEPLADYVPGQGIVIQLRIPAPQGKPATDARAGTEKEPPSQWEQTRRHLRGEAESFFATQCEKCHDAEAMKSTYWLDVYRVAAAYEGGEPATTHRPTTSALLHSVLETLAENGRHIRDLKPQERITISLNYSNEVRSPVAERSSTQDSAKTENPKDGDKPGSGSNESKSESKTKPPAEAKPQPSETKPQPSEGNSDGAAAGNAQPLPASQKQVLERWIGGVNDPQNEVDLVTVRRMYLDLLGRLPTPQEVKDAEGSASRESYDMLVQRLLRTDESAAQRHAWIDVFTRRAGRPKTKFPNRARLSVSLTKEQLDTVAANKITPVELMGVAQIRVFEPKE